VAKAALESWKDGVIEAGHPAWQEFDEPPYWCASPLGLADATAEGVEDCLRLFHRGGWGDWEVHKSRADMLADAIKMARIGYPKFDIYFMKNAFYGKVDKDLTKAMRKAWSAFDEAGSFDEVIEKASAAGGSVTAVIAGAVAEGYYGIPEPAKQEALLQLPPDLVDVYHRFDELYGDRERYRLLTKYIGIADMGHHVGLPLIPDRKWRKEDEKYWKKLSKLLRQEILLFVQSYADTDQADLTFLHDYCVDNPDKVNLLRDDTVIERLKALKRTDTECLRPVIREIECVIHTLYPPYPTNRFIFNLEEQSITRSARGMAPKTIMMNDTEFQTLSDWINRLCLENMGPDYVARSTMDGYSWNLSVRYTDNRRLYICGVNAGPEIWDQWVEYLFHDIEKPDMPMLSSFSLEVTKDWVTETIERVTVDYNSKCLCFRQKDVCKNERYIKDNPDGIVMYDIEHRHNLSDTTLIKLLSAAAEVAKDKPWLESDLTEYIAREDRPNFRFAFYVVYYDGTTYSREGWFDRRSIDSGYSWGNFMGAIKTVISEGCNRYILDTEYFNDMPRPGEKRYLDVISEDNKKHFHVVSDNYNIMRGATIKITCKDGKVYEGKVFMVTYSKDGYDKTLADTSIEVVKYSHHESFSGMWSGWGDWW
jgi:hypothetical protein